MNSMSEILVAARLAANATLAGKVGNPGGCGFASVKIKTARGEFVRMLKAFGIGRLGYGGGWSLSSYDVCDYTGQDELIKFAACQAFCKVLGEYGINAHAESRAD